MLVFREGRFRLPIFASKMKRVSFLAVREEQCVDLYLPARRVIL
jgi:hypothetical protein